MNDYIKSTKGDVVLWFLPPRTRSTIRLRYSGKIEEATSNAERQRLEAQLVETDRLYEEAGKQVSITADERIRLAAEHERLEAEVAKDSGRAHRA